MLKKAALLALCVAGVVRAEEPGKTPTPEEMMACMQMMGTPNEHHKMLESCVGTYDCKVSYRMSEKAAWESSMSTCTNEMVFGGKFLKQTYGGDMMGMPYEGLGLIGFDNAAKKFTMTWVDSMSTAAMMCSGEGSGKTITLVGEQVDPMSMKPMKYKFVMTIESPTKYVCEMYMPDPETGKETVMLKLENTKK
jgi:hypothetical protein